LGVKQPSVISYFELHSTFQYHDLVMTYT